MPLMWILVGVLLAFCSSALACSPPPPAANNTCPIGYQAYGDAGNGQCLSGVDKINGNCCLYIRGPCTNKFLALIQEMPISPYSPINCPIGYQRVDCAVRGSKSYFGNCCIYRGCQETQTITCGANNIYARGECFDDQCKPGYGCSASTQMCCPLSNIDDRREIFGPPVGGDCPEGTAIIYNHPNDITGQGFCFHY